MRRFLAVAGLLAATACASWFHGTIRTSRATFDPSRWEQVWFAALRELQVRGFVIAVADRTAGAIATETMVGKERVPCGFVTCLHRDAVEVVIAPDGSATVRLNREILAGGWTPPSRWNTETIAGIEAEQDAIARAMTQ